jgi:hypothetical protein
VLKVEIVETMAVGDSYPDGVSGMLEQTVRVHS